MTDMKPFARRSSSRIDQNKYIYSHLDDNPDSIRLLRLRPSLDPTSPLQCSLFHTTLSSAPPYIALSYAWGDRGSKDTILIDNDALKITASLKHALQRLRPEAGELIMWVDAVCIDQEDIPERNAQTANMRTIYQNAESVAVWLGLEYNESREALQLARDLNTCTSPEEVRTLISENEDDLRALVRLFRRQYWWRIWVIQEVTSGRRCMVYCGEDEISWEKLDGVCDILKREDSLLRKIFYKHQSYVRTLVAGGPKGLQISRYSPGNSAPPLLELLTSHKGKKSTEPKDKVFALVGISSSRYSFVKIDYSQSLREIYTYTARHIISTTRKLDVICLKQNDVSKHQLPSWAPNWTRGPSSAGTTLVGLHHREPRFKASGSSEAIAEFQGDGYVLTASGFVIDKITQLGKPFVKKGSPADAIPPLRAFQDWWTLFSQQLGDSPSAKAVFGRAISCGNWQLENDEDYVSRLGTLFSLAEDVLLDEEMILSSPPSRVSTQPISRASTMSNSTYTLPDDEEEEGMIDTEDKERLGTILSTSLMMNRRRLFVSKQGLIGLALMNAEVGDRICILLGCRYPVVLRHHEGHFILIGEAYVDGFMHGESLSGLENGKYELENFEIH